MVKTAQIEAPSPDELGAAMMALDERQRRFVAAYIKSGGKSATRCAIAAGYSNHKDAAKVRAFYLMRNPKILAAMREESDRQLDGSVFVAVAGLVEIASNKKHRDRYKACADILDRRGFPRRTEQAIQVEHRGPQRSYEDLLAAVADKLRLHNLGALPAPSAPVVDVEFQEVGGGDEQPPA